MDLEHERRLTAVEGRCEKNEENIAELERRQDNLEKLATSVATLAQREESVEKDVKEIKSDVKALASKPGQKWESIVDKVVWAIVGAAILFLLGEIGIS